MREIIFDTETTGLDSREDRVIEIGCVELINRFPTGRTLHLYINAQGRAIHPDALAVHGISEEHLADKPGFHEIADKFLAFVEGATLIAHNANFDMGFINTELNRLGMAPIGNERVLDTLALARRKHPMGPNSLDALCRRYGIDNSRRSKHGALLDSELLAEVYIELIGGKQATLILDAVSVTSVEISVELVQAAPRERPRPLAARITSIDREAHLALVVSLGERAIWQNFMPAV